MVKWVDPDTDIDYPETDGKPIGEGTLQFGWIVTLVANLTNLFRHRDDVFVAGDLFWYPVEGRPDIRAAPDAMVAFGRPKGCRRSYRTFDEGGVVPWVVFETWAPSDTRAEMERKREWYQRYGVKEYYEYDPQRITMRGWIRSDDSFEKIAEMDGHVSPLLGICFDMSTAVELRILYPEGDPFVWFGQRSSREQNAVSLASLSREDRDRLRAEEVERRLAMNSEHLRFLGIDPDAPSS